MVTWREGNSTFSPARTRSYARSPSIFTAETELGRCAIVPIIVARFSLIISSVIELVSAVEITSPSRSSVTVAAPNTTVAI